ncbi:AAA domain-containing protein [Cytobacillus gottheilii]|uniref:AAA domain-containing protein n=1 Tax=Cytobacillus gottheilii TaxID=859144 RepID=UPI0009B9EBE4|nr:AAA domain-containing protein [Cytobacillus gottheilii]
MTTVKTYIKEWQKALQSEIMFLKTKGSTKYLLLNGRLLSRQDTCHYYFDTSIQMKIPVGSLVRVIWGNKEVQGRILSSEGENIILALDAFLGEELLELQLYYDPWELLDELHMRLEELLKSKRKRARVQRLMNPNMEAKHPAEKASSNVHELVLRSKYNPVTYVWGPPGTGKTYTLARTAANKYLKNQKVLILAQSNQAVDVLMAETAAFLKKKGKFQEGRLLRYGSGTGEMLAEHPELIASYLLSADQGQIGQEKDELLQERRQLKYDLFNSFSGRDTDALLAVEKKLSSLLEKIRQKEVKMVKAADIVGVTLSKAARDASIYESEYDVIIIDEASMAYTPQVAFAASIGKRVIVCGDFKQLPPIASAKSPMVNQWLKEDIFHHAKVTNWIGEGELHPHLFLLKEQRRMHPQISSFTNKHVYHSLVDDFPGIERARDLIAIKHPFPGTASILLNSAGAGAYGMTERTSRSRVNLWQLLLSFQVLHEVFSAGITSIGYVSPYRSQANLMEQLLTEFYGTDLQKADILAATVHRFQGSEKDVMIFDSTDSYPHHRAGMLLTGKDSERLINVAITRSRGKFIHVADANFVQKTVAKEKTWRKLVSHQEKYNAVVSQQQIGSWIQTPHLNLKWLHARRLDLVRADIQRTKKEIVFGHSSSSVLPEEWIHLLNDRPAGVKLSLLSDQKNEQLAADSQYSNPLPFPFLIFDEKVIWLGMPVEALLGAKPPHAAARVRSHVLASFLMTQVKGSEVRYNKKR